jgi:hypothetical protein
VVHVHETPWTIGGRNIAIQKAIHRIYEDYFAKGPRWIAKYLPQRSQMSLYARHIDDDVREVIVGDYGIESFVEDYAEAAMGASRNNPATMQTYVQWVFDETRHSQALWYCLVDSGLSTSRELQEYRDLCAEDHWTFERQTGYEGTPVRAAAFAIAQERQTKKNYRNLQRKIWHMYGRPMASGRAVYPAISGVCQVLATDEGYHEAVFRRITRAYLKYWPDKALQAIWEMYERYREPIVNLPNAEAFMDAILSSGIDSPRAVIKQVLEPTYVALGLENRAALRRAAKQSWDLPDGAVLHFGDESNDESVAGIPYKMLPDGNLVELRNGVSAHSATGVNARVDG